MSLDSEVWSLVGRKGRCGTWDWVAAGGPQKALWASERTESREPKSPTWLPSQQGPSAKQAPLAALQGEAACSPHGRHVHQFACQAQFPLRKPGPQPSGWESWDPRVHAQPTADI